MRIVELSDHPGDMLHDATRQRLAAGNRAREGYEDALIQHQARVQTIRVNRARARHQHRWWTWLRLAFGGWAQRRHRPRPPPAQAAPTDAEEKIKAGIAGEQQVAAELGQALDDDWTLLHGYRNRRGEIDHLLLGPRGLFAIEVKNINATVTIDGDRWRADKYDNYGNLVEQRPIADRKGRSPSQQLNQSATELERFLHQRGQPVTVQRVVVLTHRRSRLGDRRAETVLAGTSTRYVLSLLADSPDHLSDHQRAELQRLIRRDHDFHARSPRSPRSARTARSRRR
ncbi:MAG: nuclease-related domain-containing protein [Streptosporangiaceae bacterium]